MVRNEGIVISKRSRAILLVLLGALYVATCAGSRTQKLLIHRVAYASTGDTGRRHYHSVTTGDFGIPMLTGPGIWRVAGAASIIYAPLRVAEALFWQVYPSEYDFNRPRP